VTTGCGSTPATRSRLVSMTRLPRPTRSPATRPSP